MDHYCLKFWLLLRFAFKDTIYWRCPQCNKKHMIHLSYHIEETWDKELREENRLLREWSKIEYCYNMMKMEQGDE